MNIVLKKITISDAKSPFNGLVKDVLISNGIITKIDDNITLETDKIVAGENLLLSPGWVDIFSNFCDPGYEFKETLNSGAATALSGGYTSVFTLPNTSPIVATKSQVEYIVNANQHLPITIYPLGAITKNIEGKELAEMYDMQNSGAIAFSDGLKPVQNAELVLKALQYIKATNATLIQMPIDATIGKHGLMNEGIHSTQMGLQGIPSIGEHLIIQRDIELLRYTNSKLHITGISTAKSVEMIQDAKAEGLNITCSVTPYHLFFCEEDILNYDTNLKVNPPLRSRADMMSLRNAVTDGTIDCIASHHAPQDWDNKVCEFQNASFGMIGLQTTFTALQTVLPELCNERLTQLFSTNARNIFNLPDTTITEGAFAELTLFSRKGNSTLTESNNLSKSFNTPFANNQLNGKIIGTINKGILSLNQTNL
jgi:dihydroorotase